MENHKIDWIFALERARKGIEAFEARKPGITRAQKAGIHTLTPEEKLEIFKKHGFNPDYSESCDSTGSCSCPIPRVCKADIQCLDVTGCDCECPDPPKANSHYVSNNCIVTWLDNCECGPLGECYGGRTCTCQCSGLCYYDCDDGYVWDPVTETCVKEKQLIGDGLIMAEW